MNKLNKRIKLYKFVSVYHNFSLASEIISMIKSFDFLTKNQLI